MSTANSDCAAPIEVEVDLEMDDLGSRELRSILLPCAVRVAVARTARAHGVGGGRPPTAASPTAAQRWWRSESCCCSSCRARRWYLPTGAPRASFKRAAARAATMRYRFSPAALEISSEARSGWLPWEAISKAFETKRSFLLFLSPGEHYVVPKRCFPNSGDIEPFARPAPRASRNQSETPKHVAPPGRTGLLRRPM